MSHAETPPAAATEKRKAAEPAGAGDTAAAAGKKARTVSPTEGVAPPMVAAVPPPPPMVDARGFPTRAAFEEAAKVHVGRYTIATAQTHAAKQYTRPCSACDTLCIVDTMCGHPGCVAMCCSGCTTLHVVSGTGKCAWCGNPYAPVPARPDWIEVVSEKCPHPTCGAVIKVGKQYPMPFGENPAGYVDDKTALDRLVKAHVKRCEHAPIVGCCPNVTVGSMYTHYIAGGCESCDRTSAVDAKLRLLCTEHRRYASVNGPKLEAQQKTIEERDAEIFQLKKKLAELEAKDKKFKKLRAELASMGTDDEDGDGDPAKPTVQQPAAAAAAKPAVEMTLTELNMGPPTPEKKKVNGAATPHSQVVVV